MTWHDRIERAASEIDEETVRRLARTIGPGSAAQAALDDAAARRAAGQDIIFRLRGSTLFVVTVVSDREGEPG